MIYKKNSCFCFRFPHNKKADCLPPQSSTARLKAFANRLAYSGVLNPRVVEVRSSGSSLWSG